MKESDIPKYLANIMAVSRADGVLTPEEKTALEEIASEIRAKKKDISSAEKLVSSQDYQPIPVGRYSERIRNVEDMIFVSLADGKLEDSERKLIISFAKNIRITQEQINTILSETKSRAQAQTVTVKCKNCKMDIPSSAIFCPGCGSAIECEKEGGTRIEFEYPSQGISIEFVESTSANFDIVLSKARTAPDFQECIRSNKRWFLATWPRMRILDVANLAEAFKGIRNRKAYLDGAEISWDDIFRFLWCMQERQSAYNPSLYCFGGDDKRLNLWGCRQIGMDWTEWARWFSYGKFRKKDTFVFDKKRIRHELEIKKHQYRFCPFLRGQLIDSVFYLLPDEVCVSDRSGWKYKQSYDDVPDSIKIIKKEEFDGYTQTNVFYTDGVSPIGFNVAKEILKKAFKMCNTTDVDIKEIIPCE
jgi:uncharacterized tellurite resistance protein B-like protein